MNILKRENAWVWLLLLLFTNGASTLVLGALLDVYDKEAWYAKWQNWLIGFLLFVFPFFIMIVVFTIQITVLVAAKLEVPTKELYLTPYIWILGVIIPFIGWLFLGFYLLYISIMIIVQLFEGKGEKYVN